MEGLTGLIKFDTAGFRSDFQLDVVRVTENGLKKIGMWNSTNAIEWLPETHPPPSDIESSLQNRTFIVLIAIVRATMKFESSFFELFLLPLNSLATIYLRKLNNGETVPV